MPSVEKCHNRRTVDLYRNTADGYFTSLTATTTISRANCVGRREPITEEETDVNHRKEHAQATGAAGRVSALYGRSPSCCSERHVPVQRNEGPLTHSDPRYQIDKPPTQALTIKHAPIHTLLLTGAKMRPSEAYNSPVRTGVRHARTGFEWGDVIVRTSHESSVLSTA